MIEKGKRMIRNIVSQGLLSLQGYRRCLNTTSGNRWPSLHNHWWPPSRSSQKLVSSGDLLHVLVFLCVLQRTTEIRGLVWVCSDSSAGCQFTRRDVVTTAHTRLICLRVSPCSCACHHGINMEECAESVVSVHTATYLMDPLILLALEGNVS